MDFSTLARANVAAIQCRADIRRELTDFQVREQLPFSPAGEGGHCMLLIEKTATNTDWLAKQLARFAGVDEVAIGYAGLKDRHAVTEQWFTVKTEGITEPDWQAFNTDHWQIKAITRHTKKLKRGALAGNHFRLRLTALDGDMAQWQDALEQVRENGVPNYFAEQRFGQQNLQRVEAWIAGRYKPKKRQQRSLYLSSARSWLFNLVLSERIRQGNWHKAICGDVMQLADSHSIFPLDRVDVETMQRIEQHQIHATGPLLGQGENMVTATAKQLENQVLQPWQDWSDFLANQGLGQQRRALRLTPQQFEWQFDAEALTLSFYLPAGCYATAVLRELAIVTDVAAAQRE